MDSVQSDSVLNTDCCCLKWARMRQMVDVSVRPDPGDWGRSAEDFWLTASSNGWSPFLCFGGKETDGWIQGEGRVGG